MKNLAFVILVSAIVTWTGERCMGDDQAAPPVLKKTLEADDDAFYGTEHSFTIDVPKDFVPELTDNSAGLYEGIGVFGGDRRYPPYHRHYSLTIEDSGEADKKGSVPIRAIKITWKSSTTTADAKSTTGIDYAPKFGDDTIDNIDYHIKDAYFDGINLWGSMTYQTTKGTTVVRMPFLAVIGHQASKDKVDGLLLLGRYEGPVFLKFIK